MTAPHRPSADQNAAAKGIALLVAAVVVGLVLLVRFGGGTGTTTHDGTSNSTTTTAIAATTTQPTIATGTTSTPPAQLKVSVFNGTGGKVAKAGGNSKAKLVSSGYALTTVGNDTAQRSTSVVYYAGAAQRGDAAAVAKALGLAPSAVQQAGTATLPSGSTGADVVVIIGIDAAGLPAISGGSGTSGTSGGSGTSGASGTSGGSGASSTSS